MKLWVKNTILAVILVLIIAVPLLFMGGHEFGGRRQVKSSHFSSVFRQEWAPVLSALYLAE